MTSKISEAIKATVQDSCERWYLCYEYCEKWSPGFFRHMAAREAMWKELRATVRSINSGEPK